MATNTGKPITRRECLLLTVVLCGYAILAALYSIYIPIFEASDELWHFPMVETIARTGKLPVQPLTPGESSGPWRQEGSQPPLYYGVGAWLTFWIDTSDMEQVRHENPHVAAGEIRSDQNNLNLIVHYPQLEKFPWKGTVLAVHIVRFYSVLLGVWSIYLTWSLVRELFPKHHALALGASAVHAFTPMFLFISSSVNNDNLITPLCTLALLFMVKTMKYTHAPSPLSKSIKDYFFLGCIVSLAILTKASGLGLFPLVGATIAWQVWQRMKSQRRPHDLHTLCRELQYILMAATAVLLPVLTIAGWWFYRNIRLYGDVLGLNAFYAVLGMRDVPATALQLWSERFAFAAGYWGNFGGLNVPMSQWIYDLLNATAILAALGILIAFTRWLTEPDARTPPAQTGILKRVMRKIWPFSWDSHTAVLALSWAWAAAVLVSWYHWATLTWSSQGRLVFSALPMWSLALYIGLQTVIPPIRIAIGKRCFSLKSCVPALFVFFLGILSTLALPLWIMPAYAVPLDYAEEPVTPYIRRFGDTIFLRGYTLQDGIVHPGGSIKLKLYWQALNPSQYDQSIFIHVLGTGERIIAQRDTFPGRGLVSTTWLQPGSSWTETHEIAISELAYTPDTLSLGIGLVDSQSGQRLPVYDAQQQYEGEMVLFGQNRLLRSDSVIPNPIEVQFGSSIVLQGYDVSDVVMTRGQEWDIILYWLATAPMENDYTVSVQLIDANWNKAGQNDSWPMNGNSSTSTWHPGEKYVEQRTVNIDPNAVPGAYDLRISLYRVNDQGKLEHLPIIWKKGQMPATFLILTRIRVFD